MLHVARPSSGRIPPRVPRVYLGSVIPQPASRFRSPRPDRVSAAHAAHSHIVLAAAGSSMPDPTDAFYAGSSMGASMPFCLALM
mmetsp:Transcript_38811/g.77678  ORF Transcript_38811/g.77678 Transcript_38811/m.77678 type:complete len:84 (-) Transcript_38811:653-904(-)